MKKINNIFTVFIGLLLFFLTWTTFNLNYSQRQLTFNGNKIKEDNYVRLNAFISTHNLNIHLDDLKDLLVEFFESNDYDGDIHYSIIEDDLRMTMHSYVYMENDRANIEFYAVDDLSDFDFKSKTEKRYLSNDLLKNDAIKIDYLDRSYYQYSDTFEKTTLSIYPMQQLKNMDNSYLRDIQIFVNIYTPEAIASSAAIQFNDQVLAVLGISEEGELSSFVVDSTESTLAVLEFFPLLGIRWNENLTEMPKPLLLISVIAVILISILMIFSQVKEIYVRKMNGNRNLTIFIRIMAIHIMNNVLWFVGIMGLMWIFYVRSLRPLAMLFTKQLLLMIIIYLIIMAVASVFIYFYLSLKSSYLMLKKKDDLTLLHVLSTVVKVVAVVVVVIPIVSNVKALSQYQKAIDIMEKDPIYLNSIGLDDITQPIYPIEAADLQVKRAEWTKKVNDGLLDFIKENEVGLVNTEILDYFTEAHQFDITLINDYFLNDYYQEIDVASYDFLNQRENYIIVPAEYESRFDKSVANLPTFDDAQIYYVDKTFPTLMNYGGLSKINSNPVLYIIVDDYNDVIYGYPFSNWRKTISSETEAEAFKEKISEFNKSYAQLPKIEIKNGYSDLLDRAHNLRIEIYILVIIDVMIIGLFSYLQAYSFIEVSRKKLSIQYIYGHSMVKRYGLLLITLVLSYGLLTYLLIRYNKNIDVYDYYSRSVDAPYIMAVIFFMVLIDLIVSYFVLNNFHKKNVAVILKGSE